MQNVKNTIPDLLIALVAPHLCYGCGKTGPVLCDHCEYDIINSRLQAPIRRLDVSFAHVNTLWFCGERRGALRKLIGAYKFQNVRAAAGALAALLHRTIPRLPPETVVVPVPTAPAHSRERGYDHMLLIARWFAGLRGLSMRRVLGRVNTVTQHRLNRRDRWRQAKTAFSVQQPLDPRVPYLLVDDVMTTGATIVEAARLLHEAGAKVIWVGIIARQPLDG